jgi:purine-binding chemotaxis protein CheW
MTQTESTKSAFDWQHARERLKAAALAFEEAGKASGEDEDRVLRERARQMAENADVARSETGPTIDIITFAVTGAKYALEADYINEVIRLTELTPIPSAPAHIMGITNLRGTVLTVVDACELFGLPRRGLSDGAYIAVFGREQPECGILVHHASEVTRIAVSEIGPYTAPSPDIGGAYAKGLLAGGQVLLDGEKLLNSPDLFADEGYA